MSFTLEKPKTNSVNLGPTLAFIDSVHFSNNSLNSLVSNSGQNDF